MTTFRWLHFTDLHIGTKDHGLLPAVREILSKDLRHLTEEQGAWDVVFFTGDLTLSGSQKEYAALDRELDLLWQILTLNGKLRSPVAFGCAWQP